MKDANTREAFLKLRAEGNSYEKIAKELKVSKQTLINWSKDFQNQLDNLSMIRLEAVKEQYCATREKRIEVLGEVFQRIKEELAARYSSDAFEDVPTCKLLEIFLRYGEALKDDSSIKFSTFIDMGDMSFPRLRHEE